MKSNLCLNYSLGLKPLKSPATLLAAVLIPGRRAVGSNLRILINCGCFSWSSRYRNESAHMPPNSEQMESNGLYEVTLKENGSV